MDLLALTDFILVARHAGFGKAARAAGRPKATLSRRVAELEAAMDVRLLERGPRTLKLTEEGRALFERAGHLLHELEETTTAIATGGETPRGPLRISAPLLLSQVAMGRIAGSFCRAYPEVRLEVTTEDRAVDMIEEGFDLVIRVNPAPDEALVGRVFLRDRLVVVAHPDLRAEKPVPGIVRTRSESTQWSVKAPGGPGTIEVEPTLVLSSMIMIRDAVRTGIGAARLPLSLVSGDLSEGRLVSWGDVEGSEIALWALYPTRRLLSARVSAFLDHLREAFPDGTPDELAAYVAG